jgi:hypothetical protein
MTLTLIEQQILQRMRQGHSINRACMNLKIHRTQLYRNFRRTLKENRIATVKELLEVAKQNQLV